MEWCEDLNEYMDQVPRPEEWQLEYQHDAEALILDGCIYSGQVIEESAEFESGRLYYSIVRLDDEPRLAFEILGPWGEVVEEGIYELPANWTMV